ncbi:glycerophosphodiester phosphodiesterase [Longirhabdus pacifica]|uniref:glycerophosphodiester phosphodiesterase n=1 Tax=Longirhabdus pacifica TaxID=2305227 RepID=UPI0010087A12|nr:glycerophosphodiester phosphodiesterase [Longirhabdus pacifica]
MVKILAHRGATTYCPENTMSAFEKAVELGADGLEIDVQMTSDGKLVVIHDETLERTTNGSGMVMEHSLSKLRTLDAGNWFHHKFNGEKIPTFEEVLQFSIKNQLYLNIELKNSIVHYKDIEQEVIKLVQQYHYESQVILSSFNHLSLKLCKQVDSNIAIGVLYSKPMMEPWQYAANLQATAVHPYKKFVSEKLIKECKRLNIDVHPWTISTKEELDQHKVMNVTKVISDYLG